MITDPISDMLTRIRNASAAKKAEVVLPFSKLKFGIAGILKEEGYIKDALEAEENGFKQIKIVLKYNKDGVSAITSIERTSKPGRRAYAGKNNLPVVLNNLGVAVISTSRGLMTGKKAKKAGLGGEVLCKIY